MKQAIPDDKLRRLLDVIYNKFFRKWKDQQMTEDQWDAILDDINAIMEQGTQYEITEKLIMVFVEELELRKGVRYAVNEADQ